MTCILEFVKCETKVIFQIEFIKSLFCTYGFLDTNFDERSTNSFLFQQDFEPGVGLFRPAKSGEHAHGPEAAPVSGSMHPP